MGIAGAAEWVAIGIGAFFIVAGLVNLAGPAGLREGYARWGYPDRFHLVTGALELAAGVAIVIASLRLAGIILAGLITAAAIATLVRHREWSHLPPSMILMVIIVGWLILRL